MWFFPLSFFGFQFILRLFPGLVMSDFLSEFHITATDFGLFASLYYFGYAGMQIPMALLLDRFGPRKVIAFSALLCAFAAWLLVFFKTWPVALASRFLIGIGSVIGFLGTSKVISHWFPADRYARLVGLTFSFGLLGALYGGRPVSAMIKAMGWEKVLTILGGAALLIGLLTFLFVRDKSLLQEKKPPILVQLKELLKNRTLFILAVANLLMVGALEGFADVWGIPYLMAAKNLSKVDAASIISFVFVGMLFGGPILAFFAEKFNAHYLVTALCGLLMAILFGILLMFGPNLPSFVLILMMFLTGLLCCYQVIVFAIGAKLVSPHLMNITIAFLNCINMIGGSFFHSSIGHLMDYFQTEALGQSIKTYSLTTFTYSLMLIPIASFLGTILVCWSKRQSVVQLVSTHASS